MDISAFLRMVYFVPISIIAKEKAGYISGDLTGNFYVSGICQEEKVHKY